MTSSAYNLMVNEILFGFCTIISGKSHVDRGYHIKFMQGYLNSLLFAGQEVTFNVQKYEFFGIKVHCLPVYFV